MTAPSVAAPGAAGAYSAPPSAPPQALGVTRVRVVGTPRARPAPVLWALTQLWRREGRPLAVDYDPWGALAETVHWWVTSHEACGITGGPHPCPPDVVLAFSLGDSAVVSRTVAMARARRIPVVCGWTVGEFR